MVIGGQSKCVLKTPLFFSNGFFLDSQNIHINIKKVFTQYINIPIQPLYTNKRNLHNFDKEVEVTRLSFSKLYG